MTRPRTKADKREDVMLAWMRRPADQRTQRDVEPFVDELWASGPRLHSESQNAHYQNVMDVIRLMIAK